jgi:hypothetical protein
MFVVRVVLFITHFHSWRREKDAFFDRILTVKPELKWRIWKQLTVSHRAVPDSSLPLVTVLRDIVTLVKCMRSAICWRQPELPKFWCSRLATGLIFFKVMTLSHSLNLCPPDLFVFVGMKDLLQGVVVWISRLHYQSFHRIIAPWDLMASVLNRKQMRDVTASLAPRTTRVYPKVSGPSP